MFPKFPASQRIHLPQIRKVEKEIAKQILTGCTGLIKPQKMFRPCLLRLSRKSHPVRASPLCAFAVKMILSLFHSGRWCFTSLFNRVSGLP